MLVRGMLTTLLAWRSVVAVPGLRSYFRNLQLLCANWLRAPLMTAQLLVTAALAYPGLVVDLAPVRRRK